MSEGEKQMPSLLQMAFNLTETTKDIIDNAVKNGIILAQENEINKRIDICKDCDSLDKQRIRCFECGCDMKIKTRFSASKCPKNKW